MTVRLFSILSDSDLWFFSVLESGHYWKILSKHLFFLLKTCKIVFPQIWLTFNHDRSHVFNFEWQWPLNFFVLESGYYWKILSKYLFFQLKTYKIVFPQVWLTLFLTVCLFSILSDNDLWIFSVLESGHYWKMLSKCLFFQLKTYKAYNVCHFPNLA